jgi:Mrp family chromosome partitioning ATPase
LSSSVPTSPGTGKNFFPSRIPGKPAASADENRRGLDLHDIAREEITKLVRRVFFAVGSNAPAVVMFTAVEHGSGCSWLCSRAAEILADAAEDSVCLVDANLRDPDIHRHFGVANPGGLARAVIEPGSMKKFAHQLNDRNLWLLSSNPANTDSKTLPNLDRILVRMPQLRAEFRHVLIDAPPASLYGDALGLGQTADGVVLVMEANETRRETARRAKEVLEAAGLKLLGAVLNKRVFPTPEMIYRRI